MSELATSSYRQFKPGMGVPVRITLGKPWRFGFDHEEIRLLAPTPQSFRLEGEEFEREYRRRLDGIGVERLRTIFEDVAGRHENARVCLLCFENVLKGELCHRRTFADWWHRQTGEFVPELDPAEFGAEPRLF
jgi:hypothetical protein